MNTRNSAIFLVAPLVWSMFQIHPAIADTTIGKPHYCSSSLLRTVAEGMARVSFVVTLEGSIENPVISDTSGNADVDAASLKCVMYWRYKPAMRDGQPIASTWVADIAWNPTRPPYISQLLRDCAKTVSSRYSSAIDTEGTTNFAIRFESYKVTAVSITHAGGVKEVDDAEATCLANTTPAQVERVIVNNQVDYSQSKTYDVSIVWQKPTDTPAR